MWTPRDLDIVETLTRRVRLLSLAQIQAIWWNGTTSTRTVRRRLMKLVQADLLQQFIVNAEALIPTAPLLSWTPGMPTPDCVAVSRQAKTRWNQVATPHELYVASPRSANLYGSMAGQLPPLHHRDHDLLLGHVYVVYRTQRPDVAPLWVGEDSRPKAGFRVKDPDAFLVSRGGQIQRVIESAGRYSSAQCRSFHEHCAARRLPYELW